MQIYNFFLDYYLLKYFFLANKPMSCLNLKKVDTFGNNTKSKNETKDTDTTSVQ